VFWAQIRRGFPGWGFIYLVPTSRLTNEQVLVPTPTLPPLLGPRFISFGPLCTPPRDFHSSQGVFPFSISFPPSFPPPLVVFLVCWNARMWTTLKKLMRVLFPGLFLWASSTLRARCIPPFVPPGYSPLTVFASGSSGPRTAAFSFCVMGGFSTPNTMFLCLAHSFLAYRMVRYQHFSTPANPHTPWFSSTPTFASGTRTSCFYGSGPVLSALCGFPTLPTFCLISRVCMTGVKDLLC